MNTNVDCKHGNLMQFAGDLLEEYETKGYHGRMLFLAVMHLWGAHDPETAAKALTRIDDVVMETPRIECRKRRR